MKYAMLKLWPVFQDIEKRITFLNTLFSNKKILFEFAIVITLISIISYSSYTSLTLLTEKSARVNETFDTIATTNKLNLQILNSEAELHHFILSNNNEHYNEYLNSNSQINKIYLPALKKQLEISEDKDVDLGIFSTLKINIDQEFAIPQEVIALEKQKNVTKEAINNKLLESEKTRKEVQADFDKLITLEDEELKSQSALVSSQAKNTINIIIVSIIFVGGLAIMGFIIIIFDQVKRRNLERQLILSEEKYRLIFEHVQDVYYKTDLSGKILLMSPSVEKYLGVTPEKVIGTNVSLLYANPDDRGNFMMAIKVTGSVDDYPLIFKGKDNKLIYAAASSHLIYDKEHKPIGVEGLVRDITLQRELERIKTEFVAIASHQLRSPLVAMRWLLEMLSSKETGELNVDQLELVRNIDASNQKMIDLVNILLNVSVIESGKLNIEPTATNFKVFIADLQKEFEESSWTNNQRFVVHIADDLPLINIDQKLVREVYINLLTNAIKYTPQGGEISLSISKKEDQIISQVSDNGYGISEQDQHNIFKKFFRAENIIKKYPHGNGLGLYLVKSIIELSQGKIWFKSTENKGTTFWFSLPINGINSKKGEINLSPSTIQ